jgi:hypothetical protein
MVIAVESLVFLVAGIVLAVILVQLFGRPSKPGPGRGTPAVRLVRVPRTADGREETLLTVNDRVILAVNNEGVRLSEFADQVDRLEAIATRLAAALGVSAEFARAGTRQPDDQAGIPMREVPSTSDDEIEELEARLPPRNASKRQGA